jgi:nucleoside-diphosphate-sugar epimerase
MSKGKVVVLGVNGHIGRAVAEAFVAAGWDVTGMARTEKLAIPGVRFVKGDSDSVAELRAAIGDAEIVFSGLNLPYHTWFNGRLEAQLGRVLEAMGSTGKTLLFPASIYNFAATDRLITPELRQQPEKPRGEVRLRIEQMIEAAASRGDIQAIILRAGDFYGPDAKGDWFDQVIMASAKKGKVQTVGTSGVPHAWAYLPDLAAAFASLAALRSTLGAFERFHFAGNFVTPEEMGAAIAKAAPSAVRVGRFPFVLLRLIGLVDPLMREIGKMHYLWRNPMRLSDERLEALLGPDCGTPFEQAIAETVRPFFAETSASPVVSPKAVLV